MSNSFNYSTSIALQDELEALSNAYFDIDSLKHENTTYRNKPTKNRRARHARINAKRSGFDY